MARTKIEDLAKTEEMDTEEQRAVQGGGLKKWKKKATKAVTSDKAISVGIAALETTVDVGQATQTALDKAGDTAETAGDIAGDVYTEMRNH